MSTSWPIHSNFVSHVFLSCIPSSVVNHLLQKSREKSCASLDDQQYHEELSRVIYVCRSLFARVRKASIKHDVSLLHPFTGGGDGLRIHLSVHVFSDVEGAVG